MALEIQDRLYVVKGTPIVQPTNELFWFGRPQLVLFLIHFTLFQVSNDVHAKFSLTDYISEFSEYSWEKQWIDCYFCSAECFPACILFLDMGKQYAHSVKNRVNGFTMLMMVTFCSLEFVVLWFSG